jgi:Rab GDP dissociation inhibitor
MEFKPVDGSYVYRAGGKVHKVPLTPKEAMKSSMLSLQEKTRMAQFTLWVASVKKDEPRSWRAGTISKTTLPLDTMTGAEFFKYWKLDAGTVEFLTHVCALYRDDSYVKRPALEIVTRMQVRCCISAVSCTARPSSGALTYAARSCALHSCTSSRGRASPA